MPSARRSLRLSLKRLRDLRFHRAEACSDIVCDWFKIRNKIDRHPLADDLWRVHDWLIAPLTLQALDYRGLAKHIVEVLRTGEDFDGDMILLLRLIDEPPSSRKVALMTKHEAAVAEGLYDGLTKQPRRYEELVMKMEADQTLRTFWNRIRSHYARQFRPNTRGVMRRTLSKERGFSPCCAFNWKSKRDRFQITFDALCHRWCLYGYEKDTPLALKLTANSTPHGTMIFVPRGMSLAANGTFVWKAISQIHMAHGASRQGDKLFEIRIQRSKDRIKAKQLDAEARQMGLRGEPRYQYTLTKMGQLPNRVRWLKRLLHDC
ncbi:MAG: hypothetical protein H3C27_07195 [Opitutaceae bacterium]|nr:hypothetical protein [Opitutaceae bacterium]